MAHLKTRIITVTGTKGKTSVVRLLHHALQGLVQTPLLAVDTHRIVLGNEEISTFTQSKETSGLVPTICPGRFLLSLANSKTPIAVLGSSVGSSQEPGLGYREHEIGIFTNVYDDHMGVKEYLGSRKDLARAKSFVFKCIKKGGFAIFNADDDLVRSQLNAIDRSNNIKTIACTLNDEKRLDIPIDFVVTLCGENIVIRQGSRTKVSIPVDSMPWMYGGNHKPTLYDGLSVLAALWAFCRADAKLFRFAAQTLEDYLPDETGGRVVVKTAHKGTTVIIDFAHEAESLKHIANFARQLATKGRIIWVVRLSGGRPDTHIMSTTERFAPNYDELIIYEKTNFQDRSYKRLNRKPGDMSELKQKTVAKIGIKSTVVLDETSALKLAERIAGSEDVVVYVINSSVGNYEFVNNIFHFKENENK